MATSGDIIIRYFLQCDGNDVQSQGQQEKEEKFLATDQEAGLCPGSRRARARGRAVSVVSALVILVNCSIPALVAIGDRR